MRKLAIFVGTLALGSIFAGCQTEDAGIEARTVAQYTIEDFLSNTNVFGSSFAPDKSLKMSTVRRGGSELSSGKKRSVVPVSRSSTR